MPLNVIAQQKYLRELKCAYTGKLVTVRMVGAGAARLYFSDDAFDPAAWNPDSQALLKALGTRDGIEGAARNGAELICPYSGARMSLQRDPVFGFRAVGGFRPSVPRADPFAFASGMLSRGGVAPKNGPKPARVSASTVSEPEPGIDRIEIPLGDAMQKAEDIMKPHFKTGSTVTVPDGAPRKRREAGKPHA